MVVLLGILMHYLYQSGILNFSLNNEQVVNIPVPDSEGDFFSQFTFPDFSALAMPEIWRIGVVIAIVASLETLLCVEATDKLDTQKRVTPTNGELKAQGLGNTISGLVGGLPNTQVNVRSSANFAFGGKTKMSAIIHDFFLLISAIANVLGMVPLVSLAAILFLVGYKLASFLFK